MSEIVCPSCQSRYQIPKGAIGPDGRKVNCSNCSHVWLAFPEPEEELAEAPVMETAGANVGGGDAEVDLRAKIMEEDSTDGPDLADRLAELRADPFEEPRDDSESVSVETVTDAGQDATSDDVDESADPAAPKPGDLLPSALQTLSSANQEPEAMPGASDPDSMPVDEDANEDAGEYAVSERHLSAEPQGGLPPYSGDETAYAKTHERTATADAELEPYADDEEPVLYDTDAGDGASDSEDVPATVPEQEAAEDAALEDSPEEDPAEIEARALALANSPVENMRKGQMAEIRQMLDELQSDSSAQATEPGEETPEAESAAPIPARPYEEDEYRDPLKERLAAASGGAIPGARKIKKEKDYDRDKLMKRHQRRYRRKKIAEAKTRPNAFTTGFMLIVMVAAIMTGVYLLHPQIIARLPQTETALLDYVAMVDSFREVVAEKMEALRVLIEETIKKAA